MRHVMDIKQLRLQYNITQKQLAELLAPCSVRTVQDWEGGRRNCPPAKYRLAQILLKELRNV